MSRFNIATVAGVGLCGAALAFSADAAAFPRPTGGPTCTEMPAAGAPACAAALTGAAAPAPAGAPVVPVAGVPLPAGAPVPVVPVAPVAGLPAAPGPAGAPVGGGPAVLPGLAVAGPAPVCGGMAPGAGSCGK
ncbi:hypothetical protein ACAG26_11335 [Mycobacterium sp. pUA109]|uniref:hypothetical protein n=1 Tax=Mycobacterium sp. pUA109 TaxID=3238982 RepID=UPI00351B44C6